MLQLRPTSQTGNVLGAFLVVTVLAISTSACGSSSKSKSTATPVSGADAPITSTSQAKGAPDVSSSGDIPDNQAFVVYQSASGHYSVKVPEGWARTETSSNVTFTDKLNAIHVGTVSSPNAPTIDSVTQSDLTQLQSANEGFAKTSVTTVSRKGGQAVLAKFHVDSAPDPVTGKTLRNDVERYAFWKNGSEAIVTLSSPAGADNVDPWKTVTNSFSWS